MSNPLEQLSPVGPVDDDLHEINPLNDYYFRLLLALAAIGTLVLSSPWNVLTTQHVFVVIW